MARDVARPSLYGAGINLWVEDELTRSYLEAVWNSPSVRFLIGGGSDGVQAIVNDAESAGYPNVFAVIDRDFRQTNRSSWTDPARRPRKFILPAHEIENDALDAAAIAASRLNNLNPKKSTEEIEVLMTTAAHKLRWWAACRDVVAGLRRRFREGFLSDPPRDVSTEDQARDHICGSEWFQKLPQEVDQTTVASVHQSLSDAGLAADRSLADGRWRTEFAGKEILRDVGSLICDRTRFRGYQPTPAEFDEDLAKEVGSWQRQNNAVPADLVDLLDALQRRIAQPGP